MNFCADCFAVALLHGEQAVLAFHGPVPLLKVGLRHHVLVLCRLDDNPIACEYGNASKKRVQNPVRWHRQQGRLPGAGGPFQNDAGHALSGLPLHGPHDVGKLAKVTGLVNTHGDGKTSGQVVGGGGTRLALAVAPPVPGASGTRNLI